MTLFGLVVCLLLLVGASSQPFPARRIRIVQGTPRPQPSVAAAPTPTKPVPAREPSAPNGPDAIMGLLGQCFTRTQSGYEYQLCPFKNFTQRELEAPNPWSRPFWGMLGLFDGMLISDGEDGGRIFSGMRFEDGDTCGSTPRRATIDIACLTPSPSAGGGSACVLDSVSEPETCVYTSLLRCEAACTADMSVPAGFNPAKPHPSVEDFVDQAAEPHSDLAETAIAALQAWADARTDGDGAE
ncbi:hypothetical protein FNF31_00897 [Cafeteria roenbergensis]|uniref:MRH domain-containing protein n=1 Tax=Cafeteria roenbergensis TaxID=33653 RepID=A0A5A8DQA8_CAFRO|nr:hypothetical protein FNF31_00897 [Cafeteria roenbergensis]